jgi:hypothetical protein
MPPESHKKKSDLGLVNEMIKMYQEGWRMASPYLAKSYGSLAAFAVIGVGVGASLCVSGSSDAIDL